MIFERGGIPIKEKIASVLILMAVLCAPVFGQITAEDWFKKGYALSQEGKYDDAVKAYDKAIEINPNYAYAWNSKGVALDAMGKYDEAIKSFDTARGISGIWNPSWATTTALTIFLAFLGYFLKYIYDIRLSKRAARLERVNKQLGDLYGPLYALSYSTSTTFRAFMEKYRPNTDPIVGF